MAVPTREYQFALVDVFAKQPLQGNPLAVVPEADMLTATQMARVSREFNQSETTFISRPTITGASWRLRSFTPDGSEVVGAGHNSLGAWWWLATDDKVDPATPHMRQQLGRYSLPVGIEGKPGRPEWITLTQRPLEIRDARVDAADLSVALGLDRHAVAPDRAVTGSTGSVHLLVHLNSRATVDASRPDAAALRHLLSQTGAQGCYIYSLDPTDPGHTAYARFFNPTVGISEDPATGSAAGPLAGHLTRTGATAGTRVWIEQGYQLGRPSVLGIDVDQTVRLGGRCSIAATGELAVPE